MVSTSIQALPRGSTCSLGFQKIRDYNLHFRYIDIQIKKSLRFLFPRTGYLYLYLFTGDDIKFSFLNYNKSVSIPNHTYISGLYSKGSLKTRLEGNGGGFAIKIHPVIGYYLLKVPLCYITDKQILVSDVLTKKGKYLRKMESVERICTLNNFHLQKIFLDIFPFKTELLNDVIFHAVNKIISSNGIIRIDELAKEFFMTERTLCRQFKLKVGLCPQAYAKIIQISNAIKRLTLRPEASLNDVAFDAGYYDVAHLSRDFRQHVFLKPSQFQHDLHPVVDSYLNFPNAFQNV